MIMFFKFETSNKVYHSTQTYIWKKHFYCINVSALRPKHNGHHFAEHIFNCISWMKTFDFHIKFHWSMFLRVQLIICQHWFRWWLGTQQATIHYLIQQWPSSGSSPMHITWPHWVKSRSDQHDTFNLPSFLFFLFKVTLKGCSNSFSVETITFLRMTWKQK